MSSSGEQALAVGTGLSRECSGENEQGDSGEFNHFDGVEWMDLVK